MKKIVYLMMGVIGIFGIFGTRTALAQTGVNAKCVVSGANTNCVPPFFDSDGTYGYYCAPEGLAAQCCIDAGQCSLYGAQVETLESTWYKQDVKSFAKNVFEPADAEINSDRYAKYSVDSIAMSLGIGAIGAPGQGADGQNTSAVGSLGKAIAYMVSKPAVSSGEYLAYMGNKAGFVKQAYAQGAGYRGLLPILPIWVAFRNIAYLITSLMLVVIGFMIMLRKKIDAQTVIGVQQALPRIVVTLLLITFSYAIAGLVIDMIYFLIYLMIQLAFTFGIYDRTQLATNWLGQPLVPNISKLEEILLHRSALGIGIKELWWSGEGARTAADAVGDMIKQILGGTGNIIGAAADVLSQPLAYLIISVAILFSTFKLFFALLMAYLQIVLGTIIGPLQIMMGALPGSEAFSKWLRNLLANAMAFPAAAGMFLLAGALLGLDATWGVSEGIGFINDVTTGAGFIPPLINGSETGGDMVNAIQGLIGIGIIMMTPKVVEMVKEALQAPEFKYGSAIGEAVGFGWQRTGGFGIDYAVQHQQKMEQLRSGFYQQQRRAPTEGRGGETEEMMKLNKVPTNPAGMGWDIIKKQLGLKK